MSATFLTGATGYLGSYVAANLLARGERLFLLVRAADREAGARRLWDSLQFHFDFDTFREYLDERIRVVPGDLTAPGLGIDPTVRYETIASIDSMIHCAASLNRKSERSCMNVNLRGTLGVVRLAREVAERGTLRRFSQVSTVSVAGERSHEIVEEDEAVDWARRDYDAYGRTKKFAEQLVRELLEDVPRTIFRPSIVMGDSRRPETTQFDMVRAFSFLAGQRVLPLRPLGRIDIVPVDWVADAITKIHRDPEPAHDTYHLSAGRGALRYHEITEVLAASSGRRPPMYIPGLERPFVVATAATARLARGRVRAGARLLDVFLPYLYYDTVFANERAVAAAGCAPAPFTEYCAPLLEFARRVGFRAVPAPWPVGGGAIEPSDATRSEAQPVSGNGP